MLTKLNWEKAEESRLERFEVVEIPLLLKGGAVILEDEVVRRYTQNPKERRKLRNISRMVIIKNVETGRTINFIMHITGTYDYLMKAKHFENNSYLYRDPHLDGSVYFYRPNGEFVNGWQYRDGKISGYIKQGTAEDLEMQKEVATRNWDPNCYFTEIWVSNNVCEGFVYNDPEYGLGFGSECTDMGHYETVQVCDEEIPSTGENGDSWQPPTGGGGGNSNNGGYNEPIEAPKAQKIFRNSQFTKEQWETVEQILNEMCTTDIGDALYKILLEKLKGGTVIIKFWQEKGSQLDFADKPTTITLGTKQNNGELLHELVHLLQAYTVGSDWNKTGLNREIEAHYIQELYIESYSEDKRIEWETDTRLDARWKITRKLFKYINPLTGGLQQGVTEADLKDFLEHDVIAAFREVGYSSYDYVYQIRESSLANFQHLINLLEYKNRHY